jgi:hypothetical protein
MDEPDVALRDAEWTLEARFDRSAGMTALR